MRTSNLSTLEKTGILGGLIFGLLGFVLGIGGYISANDANKIAINANDISEKNVLVNLEMRTISKIEANELDNSNNPVVLTGIVERPQIQNKKTYYEIGVDNPSVFLLENYNSLYTYSTYDFVNKMWSVRISDINHSKSSNMPYGFDLISDSKIGVSKIVSGKSKQLLVYSKYAKNNEYILIKTDKIKYAYTFVRIDQYEYEKPLMYLLISILVKDEKGRNYSIYEDYQINIKTARRIVNVEKIHGEAENNLLYTTKVSEIAQEFINVCDNK
ncbi:hypothetical protein LJB88_02185 [Erysipelotrichaceae bacterium OttesenSCG-928-M19]|nr:hypothetical protein [Erysipelotrichaceae bacterium OttesenSCG-928-M19]